MRTFFIIVALSILLQFNSVCFSADLEIREVFSITYANGQYNHVYGKAKRHAIGHGYTFRFQGATLGIFYEGKNMTPHRFIIYPGDDNNIVPLLQSSFNRN